MGNKYAVAMYLRLSNEDRDSRGESCSISAQRQLLESHIGELMRGQEYTVLEFSDDGYSGTDFSRPGVQALLAAAKAGEVSMVAVKDFSRFGRDYLEVGRYLEYIFPMLGVRFVSVNDGYDSGRPGAADGTGAVLKNLVYGLYSADLSKKTRSAKDTRAGEGQFVGAFAPYGYRKDPQDRHRLAVDETAALVVGDIFRMAADGVKHAAIARKLNGDKIPTRAMYSRMNGGTYPDRQPQVAAKRWDSSMVRNIITNEFYLGKMVWNRQRCGIDTGKRPVDMPPEEWIVVEDHHEALVTEELFREANRNIAGVDMAGRKAGKKNVLLVCGYCGRGLRCRGREASPYYCSGRNHEEENECRDIFIPRKKLEDAVLCQVRGMAAVLAQSRADGRAAEPGGRKAALEKTVSDCEKELRHLKEMKVRLYEQYKAGGITREEYLGQAGNVKERMAGLEQDRGRVQEELCRLLTAPKEELPDGELAEFAVLEAFDKDRLKKLIRKVAVYGEDRIEIVWKVKNPFEKELPGGGMYL